MNHANGTDEYGQHNTCAPCREGGECERRRRPIDAALASRQPQVQRQQDRGRVERPDDIVRGERVTKQARIESTRHRERQTPGERRCG